MKAHWQRKFIWLIFRYRVGYFCTLSVSLSLPLTLFLSMAFALMPGIGFPTHISPAFPQSNKIGNEMRCLISSPPLTNPKDCNDDADVDADFCLACSQLELIIER